MRTTCPRCDRTVEASDNFCRDCGWSLHLETSDEPAVVADVRVAKIESEQGSLLPALRAELAPYVPAVRRAAAVVAAAAVADWALRAGTRSLLHEGVAALRRRNGAQSRKGALHDHASANSVVVEQRIIVRRS